MEINSERYKVNGRDLFFRWNVRARIEFEKMTGITDQVDQDQVDQEDDMEITEQQAYQMVYCGTVAGMRKEVQPFDMDFDQYLDFVDMDVQPLIDLLARFIPKTDPGEKKKKATRTRTSKLHG